MAGSVSSVGRPGDGRRVRARRGGEAASEARPADPLAAVDPPPAAAPHPPDPDRAPPVVSAHILGQSDAAQTDPPAKTAQKARRAYLGVEWSGAADRRNRRGRIAKTDV